MRDGQVYSIFKNIYTLEQLEAQNLCAGWT